MISTNVARRQSALIDLYSNILEYITEHYPTEYNIAIEKLGFASNDLK